MSAVKDEFLKEIKTLDGPIPMLKDIWNFFNTKGMRTSIISVNSFTSFNVDLELTESLGCNIHLLLDNNECENRWTILQKTLKDRAISPEYENLEWLEGTQKRWILARNLKTKRVELSWKSLKQYCDDASLTQIDLFKVEGTNENEKELLYSLFHYGYRPSLILVRWTENPDTSVPSMLAAGHLQNVGYRLLDEKNGWFLYHFTDVCIYDTCSWCDTKCQNPIVEYFLKLDKNEEKKSEENKSDVNSEKKESE
jgi:hypothetical protein